MLPEAATSLIVNEFGAAKAWPPTRFTRVALDGQRLTLTWAGSASLYQVQRTAMLREPQWENVGGTLSGQSFSGLIDGDRAFFRVLILSP